MWAARRLSDVQLGLSKTLGGVGVGELGEALLIPRGKALDLLTFLTAGLRRQMSELVPG